VNHRDYILSPQAIRERTQAIFKLAQNGETHFSVHPERLAAVAELVVQVTKENYPTLKIPFHSRWGHFQAGKKNRLAHFEKQIESENLFEQARSRFDLVIPSVLLDAGAGDTWNFRESDGMRIGRSEGLAVASLALFESGDLSSNPEKPFRSDSIKLKAFQTDQLKRAFQVSPQNPLVGLEGRTQLIQSLGQTIEADTTHFPRQPGETARPGNLVDFLYTQYGKEIPAPALLKAVLEGLGPIWPGRLSLDSKPIGDVWAHSGLAQSRGVELGHFESLVPFHKLSQWLTYSLIEPLEAAGFSIHSIDELTGLAEYRNGGLVLDGGLISLRDASLAPLAHRPDSELVIEWRALTLFWLDQIALEVRKQLGKNAEELPLAKILEGGTWWAGRRLAKEHRPQTSAPPLVISSDGTVF
jgi:hypothetical protein